MFENNLIENRDVLGLKQQDLSFFENGKINLGDHQVNYSETRPWGSFTILESGASWKIKRLEVIPGGCLSLQMHHHRNEHWIVVSGVAKVLNDDQEFFARVNETAYIKAGCKHRLENPGTLDLVMIEVQTGNYLGEDDIVRFNDIYGRV